jgi:hypothetical protein
MSDRTNSAEELADAMNVPVEIIEKGDRAFDRQ